MIGILAARDAGEVFATHLLRERGVDVGLERVLDMVDGGRANGIQWQMMMIHCSRAAVRGGSLVGGRGRTLCKPTPLREREGT